MSIQYAKVPIWDGVRLTYQRLNAISNHYLLKVLHQNGEIEIPESGQAQSKTYVMPDSHLKQAQDIAKRRRLIL